MAAFAAIYEIISKLTHMLLVGDLGMICILSAFTEDADKIARTALNDEAVSDAWSYQLHSELRAILQAYLQQQAAKEWRRLCEELVWPPVFLRGWTEAVRLYDLGGAIAALTATEVLHVKHLNVLLWARFLQILEDAGPVWVVEVLYTTAAQNITTRDTLKNLLTANDPGAQYLSVVDSTRWRARLSNVGSVVCLTTLPGIALMLKTVPSIGRTAPRMRVRTCITVHPFKCFPCRRCCKSLTH
jgi:hypothetical protein